MGEKVLVINSGSSSVKFSLFEMPEQRLVARGNVEKIGKNDCSWIIKTNNRKIKNSIFLKNHVEAVKVIFNELLNNQIIRDVNEIKAVGHRVLHGGSLYSDSILIDDKVIDDIKSLTPLGLLHHPGEIAGIECIRKLLPETPNVAVFDTAFHQTIPKVNYMFPIPLNWYQEYGVRRYGFHGTSYKYITEYMKKVLEKDDLNLIICHIGSGASVAAIKDGVSYNTSMGLTPLDGVMMGTRCGTIDPSVVEYIERRTGMNCSEINRMLNEESGLYGIAGKNDYRDIEKLVQEGNENAILALKMFIKSIKDYIGQYYFDLHGKLDGIVFTAGIGENSSNFRKLVIDEIKDTMGIIINDKENEEIAGFKEKTAGVITSNDSNVRVFVIPTDEEKMIMQDTYRIAKQNSKANTL